MEIGRIATCKHYGDCCCSSPVRVPLSHSEIVCPGSINRYMHGFVYAKGVDFFQSATFCSSLLFGF